MTDTSDIRPLSRAEQKAHLDRVSRTFALTITALPDELCDYVSCAYLLCRIADTIEDDPKMAPSDKVDELNTMSLVFDGAVSSTDFHDGVMGRLSANEAETALMDDIPRVFARFGSYPDSVRAVISEGVRIMCAGMGAAQTAGEVRSRHDLDLYCYSVAGVVGELLAELFMQRSPEMAKERDAVMALAVSFGEGPEGCEG